MWSIPEPAPSSPAQRHGRLRVPAVLLRRRDRRRGGRSVQVDLDRHAVRRLGVAGVVGRPVVDGVVALVRDRERRRIRGLRAAVDRVPGACEPRGRVGRRQRHGDRAAVPAVLEVRSGRRERRGRRRRGRVDLEPLGHETRVGDQGVGRGPRRVRDRERRRERDAGAGCAGRALGGHRDRLRACPGRVDRDRVAHEEAGHTRHLHVRRAGGGRSGQGRRGPDRDAARLAVRPVGRDRLVDAAVRSSRSGAPPPSGSPTR